MAGRIQQLLGELRRRHVWRMAFAYAAIAVAAIQGLDILVPIFNGPDWIMRVALVFAILGFPLAIALGWVYELTPQGIRRDDRGVEGVTSASARLAFLALVAVSVASVGWWTVRTSVNSSNVADESVPAQPVTAAPASNSYGSPIRSLGVLPLDDFSPNGGNEYFAAGMHEALIASLSQVPSLRVISRTSVSQYDSTALSLPEIGAALGVDGIIEGSVVRDGDRVRITVQLIHAPSDTHLWSNTYDGEMSDVIGLQARVAEEIAREIEAELAPGESILTTSAYLASPEAQEAYMRGQAEVTKGTPEALQMAREHFSQAVDHDPSFAPALAALAGTDAIIEMEVAEVDQVPDVERLTSARELAVRAMELDSGSAEAMAAVAIIDKRLAGLSEQLRDQAGIDIRIDTAGMPDDEWVASFSELGRHRQRIMVARAERGGKDGGPAMDLSTVRRLLLSGETEHAVHVLEDVVDERPELVPAWLLLEQAQTAAGDYDEAAQSVVHIAEVDPRMISPEDAEALEDAVDEDGARGYWQWKYDQMEARVSRGAPVPPSQMAMAYAALGDSDQAFHYLGIALDEKDPGVFTLRTHPVWDPLRGDERFSGVVRRLRASAWSGRTSGRR